MVPPHLFQNVLSASLNKTFLSFLNNNHIFRFVSHTIPDRQTDRQIFELKYHLYAKTTHITTCTMLSTLETPSELQTSLAAVGCLLQNVISQSSADH